MTNYIPNAKTPTVNICQEIQNYRGREINEEMDVIVPPYLVDRRILKAIEDKNMNYLQSAVRRCPRNIERYYFLETVTSLAPLVRSVIVSNLLGYAFLYRALPCVKYLLDLGSDPYQPAYFVDWVSFNENQRQINLYEAPCSIVISGSINDEHRGECIQLLSLLRAAEVELHSPVSLKKQIFETPSEPSSSTVRYNDTWECWDTELEKKSGDDVQKSKSFLRELKAVYRANKFERFGSTK